MAAHGAEDQNQQRGILSLLQPGRPRYGRFAFATGGHGPHGFCARSGASLVCGVVRPRHADRSLQTMIVYPEFAAATLDLLGQFQAKKRDDYRDAEPGKIMHELRYGELAYFKMIPHTPYYGTADATPLYLVALHAAWQATGDRALIERHLPNAEACLMWIDKYGDRDGDGFQEYQTRSSAGYENMAWKDFRGFSDVSRWHAGTRAESTL